jgi:peptidoglycan/LPS O-acetylase OafA/YrhL
VNRQFGALRGLAILLVVLNHSITLGLAALRQWGYTPAPLLERYVLVGLKQLGLVAVPTFLFLSGTFAAYAVQGKAWRPAYRTIFASLKHVVWPYLIWSVVYYALMAVVAGERTTALGYAKHLLVGYPFNFVPLLVVFYLAAPLLVRPAQRFPALTLLAVLGYQLFLVNVLKPGALGFALPAWAGILAPPGIRLTLALWALFFPLGMVYSLHARQVLPWLQRVWPVLAVAAVGLFALAFLEEWSVLSAPLAAVLCPVAVVLLFPLLRRDAIPLAGRLEQLGKRAYGLYLTNLIVLNLALALVHAALPWLFGQLLVLAGLLFVATLILPQLLIALAERLPNPRAHRYVFG